MATSGLIFNIQRFSIHDGPGIRTTVFLKGCPLKCWWCHNPEGIHNEPEVFGKVKIGQYYTTSELLSEIVKDRIFYDESAGGVTFSGGEPLAQFDFVLEMLELCRSAGIHTAIDTSGYVDQNHLKNILHATDLILYDLKLFDPALHLKFTEKSNVDILNNLIFLLKMKAPLILRFPLIPEVTATLQNVHDFVDFLNGYDYKPIVNLLPYHNISESKYKKYGIKNKMNQARLVTPEETQKIKRIFKNANFTVNIGG